MGIDQDDGKPILDPLEYRSTRLVCAKLYEGGLLWSYSILNSIKKSPFKGKSPEYEIDINLVHEHAKVAYRYHLTFALIALFLSFLAIISYNNVILSCMFSIPTICILLLKPVYDKKTSLDNFSKKFFNPYYCLNVSDMSNKTSSDHNGSDHDIEQNVIIFGDYDPFLGAGIKIDNTDFDIDLSNSKKGMSDQKNADSLSIEELYDAVSREIKRSKLPNVSLNYLLFADGKKIDEADFLLSSKLGEPIEYLDFDTLFTKGNKEMFKDYRAYLDITYHDKNRSTLLSAFLRFSEIGTRIFAEYSLYYLPPLDETIFNIDSIPTNEKLFNLKLGVITLCLIVADILLAPFIIFSLALFVYACRPIIKLFNCKMNKTSNDVSTEAKIKKGSPINFGEKLTFRESIADYKFSSYFSSQDVKTIGVSLVKSIFGSTADLLDSKGLDSSYLRKTMIPQVTQNITNFNGDIRAKNVAVGEKSSINNIENIQQKKPTSSNEAKNES